MSRPYNHSYQPSSHHIQHSSRPYPASIQHHLALAYLNKIPMIYANFIPIVFEEITNYKLKEIHLLQFPISLSPFVHVVESHWHLQFTKSEAALVFTIDFPDTCPILEFCPMASWVTRPKIRRKIFILTLIDAWIEMCLQLVIYLCFYSSTKAVHWKHTGDWIICLVRSTAWFSKLVFRSPSYEWGASSYLILPWEHIRTHCKI